MVILNVESDDYVFRKLERKGSENSDLHEWRVAVSMVKMQFQFRLYCLLYDCTVIQVLPNLLGNAIISKKRKATLSYENEIEENAAQKSYVNTFLDFGRWILDCGRFRRSTPSNKKGKHAAALYSNDDEVKGKLKDFLILLGNLIVSKIKMF